MVDIVFPEYRGNRLADVLAWLVTHHLTTDDAKVIWRFRKNQVSKSIHRHLLQSGWQLDRRREGRDVLLVGSPLN